MSDSIAYRLEAMRLAANAMIAQSALIPGTITRIEPLYPHALPAPDLIRCELTADDDQITLFHVSAFVLTAHSLVAAAHTAFISCRIPEITECITGDADDAVPYPAAEADDEGPKPGDRIQ